MASIISATTTNGLVTSADNSGSLQLATNNGTTAVTIDTSQNVGIGTSSPSAKLDVLGKLLFSNPSGNTGLINNGVATGDVRLFGGSSGTNGAGVILYGGSHGATPDTTLFMTGSTERMRIDSSGYVGIGNSSPGSVPARLVVSQGGNIAYFQQNAAGGYCGQFDATVNGGTYYFVNFLKAGVGISNITSNGTTISYNTGSDYRLKDNIEPITNALETVAKLKPSKWNWKEFWGGGSSQGFVAHELAEIIPDCVTGEKDAVDENGKPVYQGVDTSFLVATLTAAIQELKAELDATKAEVQALKGTL